ncbi:hypothetical protein [Gillisia sp. JM1]|uniref:ISAon1 family transposase N-terminal region protein n=1 Tax=Gillisia sp. JM1 TaxID=1283286 RepID=UPI0004246577|nr:hypothetical protein [Gillisia sp. JM1]
MDKELARYLLPEGILEYFEIISHKSSTDKVHFYLEEKNILPKEHHSEIAQSKGFLPEITVEDFPLRGKSVLLHIKRRRWTLVNTGEIVKRDWNLIAKGTRITNEFASFLKGIA